MEQSVGSARSRTPRPSNSGNSSRSTRGHLYSSNTLSSSICRGIRMEPSLLPTVRPRGTMASRSTSSFLGRASPQRGHLLTEGRGLSQIETRRAKKRGRDTSRRPYSVRLLRITRSSRSTYHQQRRAESERSLRTHSAEVLASRRTSQ